MADDPKPDTPPEAPTAEGTNISPAPLETGANITMAAATEGAVPAGSGPSPATSNISTDALNDGTVPTVLSTGSSHKSVPKGRVSITTIYRKADIMTTVFTFVGALIAAGAIFGAYMYLSRSKAPAVVIPKVANLSETDLTKLSTFFDGNTAGTPSQILTVSSSSLFKNRVAISSDLKVVGGLQTSGTTALADLTVDKVSTLGVTNIRGALVVAGPVSFQNPAQFSAGASLNGNLAVTGNGSFGGSLSAGTFNARDISVTGNINLAGHLSITGPVPSAAAASGLVISTTIEGSDSSGTVTVNTATSIPNNIVPGGQLVTITFRNPYPRVPHIIITPIGASTGKLDYYIIPTATNFIIGTANQPSPSTGYSFSYWVVQ